MLTSTFKTLKVTTMPTGFLSVKRQETITDGVTGAEYILTPTIGCRCGDDALAVELGVDHIASLEWSQSKRAAALISAVLPERAQGQSGVMEARTQLVKYADLTTGAIRIKTLVSAHDIGSGEIVRALATIVTDVALGDDPLQQPAEVRDFMGAVHTPEVIAGVIR